jgi:plastocyanin
MNERRRGAALLGLALCSQAVYAGIVTINVAVKPAGSPEDTVIVFDPLDAAPAPSHEAAQIDQIDRKFVPRVTIVRSGTSITFPNSDRVRHQVYSFSPAKVFSLKLYAGSPQTAILFDQPGLVILGCNIHDKMVAFVGVVDSPYFAKVPASGNSAVNLPPGRYRLKVWNPNLTAAIDAQEISVKATPLTIPLVISLDSAPAAVAPWPE